MSAEGIFFHYHFPGFRIASSGDVKAWIDNCGRLHGRKIGRIDYVFSTDAFLLELNRDYLQHDTYTDIITFDYSDGDFITGEIYISVERLRENAGNFQTLLRDELHRVMIHGVLHLCGYSDADVHAKSVMTEKEDYCLSLRTFL